MSFLYHPTQTYSPNLGRYLAICLIFSDLTQLLWSFCHQFCYLYWGRKERPQFILDWSIHFGI